MTMRAVSSPKLFLAVTVMEMLLNSSTLSTEKDLLDPGTVPSMVAILDTQDNGVVTTSMK